MRRKLSRTPKQVVAPTGTQGTDAPKGFRVIDPCGKESSAMPKAGWMYYDDENVGWIRASGASFVSVGDWWHKYGTRWAAPMTEEEKAAMQEFDALVSWYEREEWQERVRPWGK